MIMKNWAVALLLEVVVGYIMSKVVRKRSENGYD